MLIEELTDILDGEVTHTHEELEKHSKDTSLFQVEPQAVVYPKHVKDLIKLVVYTKDNPQVSLTARAGGTCMSGGPLSESVVVNMTKFFTNFSVDPETQTARVQPGVYYRDFEKETHAHNLEMPTFPASKSICALGGMIMNNSGGEKSLRYGQTRNFVESMKVVLSDGNEYEFKKLSKDELDAKMVQKDFEGTLYRKVFSLLENNYETIQAARPRTSKNSSGYALWDVWNRDEQTFDMTQLFTGSQGTLGLMSEATLRLVTKPKHERLIVLFFKDWKALPDVVNRLLPFEPEGLETFDDATLKLGLRFMPKVAKRVGEPFMRFAVRFLPEVLVGLRMLGLPKLIVLVQLAEESEEMLEQKTADILKTLKGRKAIVRVSPNKKDAEKYWVMRRESFRLLREHSKGKRTIPLVEDFCVQPEVVPEFLPKVIDLLERYGIRANITGHAGSGNFHIIPLMDLRKAGAIEKLPQVADEYHKLVVEYGGTITAEHNDGILRTPYLELQYGREVTDMFADIKKMFDPNNIFNPGKKVGGTREYMAAHIAPNT